MAVPKRQRLDKELDQDHLLELSDDIDDLDDEDRAELHAALDRSIAEHARGEQGRDADEVLAEMRRETDRWIAAHR